jgi:hypothetical protein
MVAVNNKANQDAIAAVGAIPLLIRLLAAMNTSDDTGPSQCMFVRRHAALALSHKCVSKTGQIKPLQPLPER